MAFIMVGSVKQHLDKSTARVQYPWVQCQMEPLVARLLHSMSRDKELRQLTTFGLFCRSRKQRRQLVPYPAAAWKWKTVQAFDRRISQLVNILELTSLLNDLRPFPTRDEIISCRLFRVRDSLVEASMAAKDGSSCFLFFYRVCRLLTSIELGTSSRVLTLWTVSH